MSQRIVVINPNSTQSVTDALSDALQPLRLSGGPAIDCETLQEGPPGIESEEHVRAVVPHLRDRMLKLAPRTDAFVIACYSDPGLSACREAIRQPVFGMAESGMLTALARGHRFGVISLFEDSVRRHRDYVEKLGLAERMAADLPVGMGVVELATCSDTFQRLESVGRKLVSEHASDVVILGCAGMSPHRIALEESLGVAVIDPTQAAVSMALGAVRCAA